jgi:hypothetical protein
MESEAGDLLDPRRSAGNSPTMSSYEAASRVREPSLGQTYVTADGVTADGIELGL